MLNLARAGPELANFALVNNIKIFPESMLRFSTNANQLPSVQELYVEEKKYHSHAKNLRQGWSSSQPLSLLLHQAMYFVLSLADMGAETDGQACTVN